MSLRRPSRVRPSLAPLKRATTEKDVTVKAMTKTEAKEKAQATVEGEGDVPTVSVTEV